MAQDVPSLKEIRDAVNAVGLKLTANELRALQKKEVVSLEAKPLSDFAKLLAEAEALYKRENPRKVLSYIEARENLTAKPCTGHLVSACAAHSSKSATGAVNLACSQRAV